MKRLVKWSKYESVKKGNTTRQVLLDQEGVALFHEFGLSYEELDTGGCCYTTAIIELECGQVLNIPAEHIRFLKES